MSQEVGRIDLGLDVNKKYFNSQLKGISKGAESSVMGAFKGLGGKIGLALGVGALISFTKSSLELGSNLSEVQNVVDTVFPNINSQVNNFASNAIEQFGLSETVAKKYIGTLGAMSKSMGFSESASYSMASAVAGLSGDVASFYNMSSDEAYTKLKSIWTGETESLKELGVIMTQANLDQYALANGFGKSTAEMTEQEKAMLRYRYVMSSLSAAQGDFSKTSGSWANQVRVLGLQFDSFKATMGQGFINLFTPLIQMLNAFVGKLQIAAQYFKAFTELITGAQQSASSAVTSTEAMADATGGVGTSASKAGKAIKGALAGFDQLNVLSSQTADNLDGTASSVSGMEGIDLGAGSGTKVNIDSTAIDEMKSKLQGALEVAGKVKDFLVVNFGPPIKTALDMLKPSIDGWKNSFSGLYTELGTYGEPLKNWFINSLVPAWKQGIVDAGIVLSGLSSSALNVFNTLKTSILPIIETLITEGLPRLTEFTLGWESILMGAFNSAKTIFDKIWLEGITPAMDLIKSIVQDALGIVFNTWDEHGTKIVEGINEYVGNVTKIFTDLWDVFLKPIVENMLKTLSWLWESHLKGMVEKIVDFVAKAIENGFKLYNKFILPLVGWLVKTLGPSVANVFNYITDVLGTAIGVIADIIGGLFEIFGGIIDFITGVFTGDWEQAWEGVKDIFKGVFDGLYGIVKGVINLIIDGLNYMIRALNKINIDVPDWVEDITGMDSFGFSIKEIPKLAQGGLVHAPTLAMVGDNKGAKHDPEVISPLSKLQAMLAQNSGNSEMVAILSQMLELMKSNDNKQDSSVSMSESELGRALIELINSTQRKAGRTLLKV